MNRSDEGRSATLTSTFYKDLLAGLLQAVANPRLPTVQSTSRLCSPGQYRDHRSKLLNKTDQRTRLQRRGWWVVRSEASARSDSSFTSRAFHRSLRQWQQRRSKTGAVR